MAERMKKLPGAGSVFDLRGTGVMSPNGGKIPLMLMVEHIPVIRNVPGLADFQTLARVINDQGLGLQAATDAEGQVALFTNLNMLCWQAKGANSFSCGVEHMHFSISEPWRRAQFNASAWLWHYANVVYGLPMERGKLAPGNGVVRVLKRGHVSHAEVSAMAGFHDRTDPGPLYDWDYVRHAGHYFARKKTFVGA